MNDMNNVNLIGRLTRDADLAYTPSGLACAKASLAVNRSKKENGQWVEEVSYFDVTIWGKTAENLKQYLLKGKQVAIEGSLKQDRWKDADGNNRSHVKIIASNVQLLGGAIHSSNAAAATFKPLSKADEAGANAAFDGYKDELIF